jgi:RNA polymerase sigma-B factor
MDAAQRRHDEALLAAYAQDPDPRRLDELVERFQPLVRSLAGRYRGRQEPFEDLLQVANLGLLKALRGYDPERGTSFSTYAVPTILGELRRHFRDRVWNLRLPRPLQESTLAVEAALERLSEELGRTPTKAELAVATELSVDRIDETLVARDARWTAALDAPIGEEGERLADQLGRVDFGFDRIEAEQACRRAVLEPREKVAIELRFIDGMTQAEVGRRLGCSQMQVSRLSRRGLYKLLAAVRGESPSEATA